MSSANGSAHVDVDALIAKELPAIVELRHDLHQHPELPNREFRTAKIVADYLKQAGVEDIRTGIAKTGVIGVLRGAKPGKTICLRADMDALPVLELQDLPYKSTVVDNDYPGGPFPVMHACGHDTHVAMLLGAAKVLCQMRDQLEGTVVFLFQPAEEGPPLPEDGGARLMLAENCLAGIEPGMVFGMHVVPMPVGHVGLRVGSNFAASRMIRIEIQGKQVHGSMPWGGRDPLVSAGNVITALPAIYRQMPATSPFTISIGHVVDQGRFNIIGDKVTLYGTVRALEDEDMEALCVKIKRTVDGICQAHDCTVVCEFLQAVPAIVHTEAWTRAVWPTLERVAGKGNVNVTESRMGYDDVSEFINRYGGIYAQLGCQDLELDPRTNRIVPTPGGKGIHFNHNGNFYARDEALPVGIKLHTEVTLAFLKGEIDVAKITKDALETAAEAPKSAF
ncbi:N-acyl-L-amino acid amidohydrolase [Hyaloraphidium curvatum]|nr:N-acyl-L-amino acid amidohydrolase [Hyaloraphidium curvatum]